MLIASLVHFIFPTQKDGLEDERKFMKEEEDDTESFKDEPVLISIADGRLPDERPNYEYFSRLLNAENDVFIRPKQCWIFVSSSKIALKEKHVTSEDGTTKKQVIGNHSDGLCLNEADYPHLKLNESKEYKDLPRQGNQPTVLLHEYTKTLTQKESSSVKEISRRWDVRFPELREKLSAALDDTHPSDERTSRCVVGPCDTFHFETVLDLHSTSKFPAGSDLNGLVEFTIGRPDLHNHSWRSRTCVIKPDELYMSDVENEYWEESSAIDVIPSHRAGCTGASRCDCTARGSRDTISIPFPATSWANTFIRLAPYVTAERERQDREEASKAATTLSGRAEREAARTKKDNEETSSHKPKGPSPKELLSQVAMYQEVWSAPQGETAGRNGDDDSSSKRNRGKWTRRAVILWTFVPSHHITDKKGKKTLVPPGTNWRFLTKVDPTSSYHREQAYVSGSPTAPSRDSIMSPNPVYAHHVNAAMHENFSASYNSSSASTFSLPNHTYGQSQPHMHQHNHLGLSDVLGGFSNGLTTPPPTATFPPAGFSHSFDANSTDIGTGHTLHHQLSFMSDRTSGTSATDHSHGSLLASTDPSPTESFLPSFDIPNYLGDLPTRYMGGGHTTAEIEGMNWADARALPVVGTMEPQWAALAAAAATVAGGHNVPQQQQQQQHEGSGTELQSTWATWQATADFDHAAASDYSRRTSASVFDDGEGDNNTTTTATFALSGTGLTPLRTHTESPAQQQQQHHTLGRIPVLTSHAPQQQRRQYSPTLAGRKRSRTESIGIDAGDDEDESDRYPVHSIRKLAHHPAAAATASAAYAPRGGAPAAVMDDGAAVFF